MDGEFTDQAGDRKNPQHPLLRRGEQQVPPRPAGGDLLPRASAATPPQSMNSRPARSTMILGSRATAAASAAATSAASARSSSPRNATTTWPSHSRVLKSTLNIGEPPCFSNKAGSRPSGQFTFQYEQYAEHPVVSCPGGREFTAVPLRSAIRPRLPSTTGCGNPPQPGSPGHAHWLPDGMPAPAMTMKPGDLWPPARPARRRPGSASRWPRHPHNRTHSHCPRDDARLPPDRAPGPGNSPPPPADPRRCARRAVPGRGRHDRPVITNTDHKSRAQKITFPASGRIRAEVPVILQDRRDVRGRSLW